MKLKPAFGLAAACAMVLTAPAPGWSQPRPQPTGSPRTDLERLGRDIQALKVGQERLAKDLEEIKALLRSAQPSQPAAAQRDPIEPAPPGLTIDIRNAPYKGAAGAKLVLVDFNDFQ